MNGDAVLPRHVAVVMDGNGRWATRRHLPRIAGHRQGVESLKRMVRACAQRSVEILTVFAFSSENWNRPVDEVSGLMDILVFALGREAKVMQAEGVRLRFVGDRSGLADKVRVCLADAEALTQANSRLKLNICFNYGGRWDVVQAAQRLVAAGAEITEASLAAQMGLAPDPDPDLVIRTGGELRISNFLLWQSAYSEFHFSDALWPDFDEGALDAALREYARRQRRFGKTPEQVQGGPGVGLNG